MCLESVTPGAPAVLPCAHIFHHRCILGVVAAGSATCPTCRKPFSPVQIAVLGGGGADAAVADDDALRFGTKLAEVGRTIRKICREEPNAKMIVFVQWKELEALVGQALDGMGIAHIRLRGAATQRSRLIAEFQDQPLPRVLLQSLENSASGANLTRASHVLLVHPMDADSPERAVAYEMQALGRVRRCGQEARVVHLWRFVTRATVEEEISAEHRSAVASRLKIQVANAI